MIDVLAFFFLGALAFALPWDVFQRIPYTSLTVVKVAGGLGVILAAIQIVSRQRALPRTGLEWPSLVFAAGWVVSTIFSVAPGESARQLALLVAYGLFVYAGAVLIGDARLGRILLRTYYVAAVGVAVVTFFCTTGVLWPTDWKPTVFPYGGSLLALAETGAPMRMAAASPDLNQGALLLAVAFTVGLFSWGWSRRRWVARGLLVVCQGALVGAIVVAQSRSALAAVSVLTLVVIGGALYRRSSTAAIALGVACVLAVIGLWQWPPAREWVLREDDSVSSRTWAYRAALELLPHHWATGVGLGASGPVIAESRFGPQVDGMAIHNVPLKLAIETGLLGFAGYALLWIVIVVMLGRAALRGESSALRVLARTGLAAAFVVFCMQMVQPFVALPVYPFLLAVVIGPIATTKRETKIFLPTGTARVISASAACLVLSLVLFNQSIFQRNMDRVVGVAPMLRAVAELHEAGRWEQSTHLTESLLLPIIAGVNNEYRRFPAMATLPFYDVMADVADMNHAYQLLNITMEAPNPEAATFFAMASGAATRADLPGARKALERAVSIEPKFAQAHFMLGEILWAQGAQEAALQEYQFAARYAETWRNRRFRERMRGLDARIAALDGSADARDREERAYWMRKRGRVEGPLD